MAGVADEMKNFFKVDCQQQTGTLALETVLQGDAAG